MGYGASLVPDGRRDAYLIRAFASLEERREREEGFYGSDAWRDGPRAAILSRIDSYHTVVLETSEDDLPTVAEESEVPQVPIA